MKYYVEFTKDGYLVIVEIDDYNVTVKVESPYTANSISSDTERFMRGITADYLDSITEYLIMNLKAWDND